MLQNLIDEAIIKTQYEQNLRQTRASVFRQGVDRFGKSAEEDDDSDSLHQSDPFWEETSELESWSEALDEVRKINSYLDSGSHERSRRSTDNLKEVYPDSLIQDDEYKEARSDMGFNEDQKIEYAKTLAKLQLIDRYSANDELSTLSSIENTREEDNFLWSRLEEVNSGVNIEGNVANVNADQQEHYRFERDNELRDTKFELNSKIEIYPTVTVNSNSNEVFVNIKVNNSASSSPANSSIDERFDSGDSEDISRSEPLIEANTQSSIREVTSIFHSNSSALDNIPVNTDHYNLDDSTLLEIQAVDSEEKTWSSNFDLYDGVRSARRRRSATFETDFSGDNVSVFIDSDTEVDKLLNVKLVTVQQPYPCYEKDA